MEYTKQYGSARVRYNAKQESLYETDYSQPENSDESENVAKAAALAAA
jgi:hypothetical protein